MSTETIIKLIDYQIRMLEHLIYNVDPYNTRVIVTLYYFMEAFFNKIKNICFYLSIY